LNNLLALFANNILPIFLAAGAGFLAQRIWQVNPRSLSQVAFYIFSPNLIFHLLTSSQLATDDVLRMAGFALVVTMLLAGLAWWFGRLIRLERRMLIAVILTVMFSNAGNYGLSLNLFAFGETGLAHASIFFVVSAILMYTVGVFIASLGSSTIGHALLGLFKVPAVYAVVLALLFNRFNWELPTSLDRTVSLLGNAAIPVLLVLMGVQLAGSQWNGQKLAMTVSNSLRLVASPLIALLLAIPFGLEGAARQAGVSEAAMPTAVITIVLATEFDVEPAFVTGVVFTSTLLSPLTLTPLLAYLGA
jgi:malate permease and related proteins